jgi:hypothetical protein
MNTFLSMAKFRHVLAPRSQRAIRNLKAGRLAGRAERQSRRCWSTMRTKSRGPSPPGSEPDERFNCRDLPVDGPASICPEKASV